MGDFDEHGVEVVFEINGVDEFHGPSDATVRVFFTPFIIALLSECVKGFL